MIEDVLAEIGVRPARHGEARAVREGWVGVPCPFCGHGPDDAYLGFPLTNTRLAVCWSCGKHSLVKALTALSGGWSWREVEDLLDRYNVWGPAAFPETATGGIYREPAGVSAQPTQAHLQYLERRGLDRKTVENLWDVRYIGAVPGGLPWRLFLPVHYRGRAVSWTTRAIGSNPNRYVSADPSREEIFHKDLLYGADLARHSVVVVEGPVDAMSIGPGAVATFGTGVTQAQLAKLAQFPVRAFAFDNEEAAQRRAREWARALAPMPGVTDVVRLESANDWNEADPAEVAELRRKYCAVGSDRLE